MGDSEGGQKVSYAFFCDDSRTANIRKVMPYRSCVDVPVGAKASLWFGGGRGEGVLNAFLAFGRLTCRSKEFLS